MAITELNLGTTFEEFLKTLNTTSTDTQGVIDGTKTIKKLKLGETSDIQEIEETENFKTIKIISEKADGYSLVTGKVDEIGVNKSTGINSKLGRFSIYSRRQEKDNNGLDTINNEALIGVTDEGRISLYTADKKNFLSSQILLDKNNITFTSSEVNNKVNVEFSNANVDFSNATVTGLPNSGGTSDCETNAIIDVTTLPTENINENVIYRLNIATYLFGASAGYQPFPMAKCNVVETLPTSGNPAATFDTSLNVTAIETYYEQSTNRNMGYVDETLSGIGNMPVGWYTAEQLFAVINRPYYGVIFSTSEMVDMGIYLLIEYSLYTYKNGIFKSLDIDVNKNYQWNGDNSFNGNNTFNGGVRLYGYTNFIGDPSEPSGSLAIYTNGFGIHSNETTFTKKVFFNGDVDFSNANITGLPSSGNGGLDISPAIIKYDNEYNSLNIENPNGSIAFNSNEGFTMFNGDGAEIYFSDVFELYGAKAIFYNGAHINNELTIGLRGARLTENDDYLTIADTNNIYLMVDNENGDGSYIDIYTDHIEYASPQHDFNGNVNFSGDVDFTNANVIGLPSSGGLDTTADITWDGDHKFYGNVQFFADCGMDYINCDSEASFNGNAIFNGNVDFSNANVTGLPSNGLTQEQVQEMINASITEALNDEY